MYLSMQYVMICLSVRRSFCPVTARAKIAIQGFAGSAAMIGTEQGIFLVKHRADGDAKELPPGAVIVHEVDSLFPHRALDPLPCRAFLKGPPWRLLHPARLPFRSDDRFRSLFQEQKEGAADPVPGKHPGEADLGQTLLLCRRPERTIAMVSYRRPCIGIPLVSHRRAESL